jgi:hypothetical protein
MYIENWKREPVDILIIQVHITGKRETEVKGKVAYVCS